MKLDRTMIGKKIVWISSIILQPESEVFKKFTKTKLCKGGGKFCHFGVIRDYWAWYSP